jgi:hypothetical protein
MDEVIAQVCHARRQTLVPFERAAPQCRDRLQTPEQ